MEQFIKLMQQVIKPSGNSPVYNCMLRINDKSRGINFTGAIGTTGEEGLGISTDYPFRTGSITKLFTSTLVLQLEEEGFLSLDDLYFDLINEETRNILSEIHLFESVDFSARLSIHQLLEHRTGLPDYFSHDERFLNFVMEHPSQVWNWKLVIKKYFEFGLNEKVAFAPGTGFLYSDTNYLLLAVLIEDITGKPLHESYRDRIIFPLNLIDTYLEFYESPLKEKPVVYPYHGIHSLREIHSSFDWGAGGLVSTMVDLETFITGLFKGHLLKKREGIFKPFGSGIQKLVSGNHSFFGHRSTYGSLLFFSPVNDISMVLTLNQTAATLKAEWLLKKTIMEFDRI